MSLPETIMKILKVALSLSSLALIIGCSVFPDAYRPVVDFKRKHPGEYDKYTYVNPVSLNTYRIIVGERAGAASYILDETERRFGSTDGVNEFVKKMTQREGEDRQRIIEFLRSLEEDSSNGGVVCQYEWSDGKTKETGFLVLKSGEIVRREPWITDYLPESKEKKLGDPHK